ncbi:MAG TPA: response regulator [Azospirillaceae bacterium]|nr:response regulator [Azospirillaceae bacterium]
MPVSPPSRSNVTPLPGSRRKVLIVEDDAAIALAAFNRLQSRRFEVCGIAATLDEALRMAAEHWPDIVVMDIRLKEGNGIEAAHLIRSNYASAILFATAFCDEHRDRLPEDTWCLQKPYDMNELQDALEALCLNREGLPIPIALPPSLVRL